MKYIFITMSLLFASSLSHGQSSYPESSVLGLKAPDAAAFEAVGMFPTDEYSGRTNITIPIYEITIDGIKIPISLSYDTSGNKVDDLSSRVGLGWSLNAGGMITKSIQGDDDFAFDLTPTSINYSGIETSVFSNNSFQVVTPHNEFVAFRLGYLMSRDLFFPQDNWSGDLGTQDYQPDIYHVSVPGLNTKFIHNINRQPIELNQQHNKISTQIGTLDANLATTYRFGSSLNGLGQIITFPTNIKSYDVQKINIISNNGMEYSFDTWEHASELMLQDNNTSGSFYHTSYPITKIRSPRTKKEINFNYERVDLYDFDHFKTVKNNECNSLSQFSDHRSRLYSKKLVEINFDQGKILFHYDHDREDLEDEKALTQIDIVNNRGKLIKRMVFKHSYYITPGCDEVNCKRLKLDEIYYSNDISEYLPGYKFDYDNTSLPKRHTSSNDFSGYYNGATLLNETNKPTLYFYIDQNKSILPFQVEGDNNYYTIQGDYNMDASLPHAKAGILERITYPTGGYQELEYELNSFMYFNTEIEGGGLRVSQSKLYNDDGDLAKQLTHNYKKEDNTTTSGSIVMIPKLGVANLKDFNYNNSQLPITYNDLTPSNAAQKLCFKISNRPILKQYFTKGALVGYSRVVISESGNGKVVKEYTNPSSHPNEIPNLIVQGAGSYWNPIVSNNNFRSDYGFFPTLYHDNDINRGNLTKVAIFEEAGAIKSQTINTYLHEIKDVIPIAETAYYLENPYDGICCLNTAETTINIERNLLSESKEIQYHGNNTIDQIKEYNYLQDYDFLKEIRTHTEGGIISSKLFYPFEYNVSQLPLVNTFLDLNRLSTSIKEQTLFDDGTIIKLISERVMNYSNFNSDLLELESVSIQKANLAIQNAGKFNRYANNGNLLEFENKTGTPVTFIWGYNQNNLVAEIIGANYNTVLNSQIDLSKLNGSDQEIALELDKIKTEFTDNDIVTVKTSLYEPLVGVTQITDAKNYTLFYEYDNFNRLKRIRDNDENIVQEYDINYKGWQTTTDILSGYLTHEVLSEGETGQYKVNMNSQNGSGNYQYTWIYGANEVQTTNDYLIISNSQWTPLRIGNPDNDGPIGIYEYHNYTQEDVHQQYADAGWNLNVCSNPSASSAYGTYIAVICRIKDLNTNQEVERQILLPKHIEIDAPPIPIINISQSTYSPYIIMNYSVGAYCGGSGNYMYQWSTDGGTTYGNEIPYNYTERTFNCANPTGTTYIACRIRDTETGQVITVNNSFANSSVDCDQLDQDCFIAGTKITMADGSFKNIEDVKIGERILSYNFVEKTTEIDIVEDINAPEHLNFIKIVFDNEVVNTNTSDHPYYVEGKGWASYNSNLTYSNYGLTVSNLSVGDICYTYNATTMQMKKTTITAIEKVKKKQVSYNLTKVKKNNNFFANGILVHNKYN